MKKSIIYYATLTCSALILSNSGCNKKEEITECSEEFRYYKHESTWVKDFMIDWNLKHGKNGDPNQNRNILKFEQLLGLDEKIYFLFEMNDLRKNLITYDVYQCDGVLIKEEMTAREKEEALDRISRDFEVIETTRP